MWSTCETVHLPAMTNVGRSPQGCPPGLAGKSGGCIGLLTLGPHVHNVCRVSKAGKVNVTVAILAQGTLWAVALAQAFF